jgi:hypothetical protein
MRHPLLATVVLAIGLTVVIPGVAAAAPPSNDNIANARVIPPGAGSVAGNTEATAEVGEPAHAGNPASHSIWFRFTADHNGQVQVDTCGSAFDTVLAVYTGGPDFASLSLVDDDDDSGCGSGSSQVVFAATAGTTYRIAMDGKAGATGVSQLGIHIQPLNADFAAATVLNSVFASSPGTNFFGGKEAGEPNHAGDAGGNSVWFRWTPIGDGTVDIDTCGSTIDTLLAVYTGSSVNALTPVPTAANDDTPGCDPSDTGSRVSFPVQSGTTYLIAVDGKGGAQGTYTLTLEGPPPNDLFASAEDLGDRSNTSGGSNQHAAKQAGEPSHAGDPGGHSVWFRWTPSESGPVLLNTCNSSIDTLLAVYTGSAVGALTEVASDDDGGVTGCSAGDSRLTFTASAGTTYRIAVDAKGAGGIFQLDLDVPPGNDDFANAEAIGGSFLNTGTDLVAATKEGGEPDHAGDPGGRSVWYRWTATVSGSVDLGACANDAGVDMVLAVYTGSALAGLSQVAANDDGTDPNCFEASDSGLSFAAIAGTTYRIAVDAKPAFPPGASGLFSLYLDGPADTAAPETTLVSGPGASASPDVTFTYAAVPAFDVSLFECRLDSDDVADFQPCPASGRTFTGLADGPHRFDVRATDFDANVDLSPATRSFTVDTVAPETTIVTGPSGTIETDSASFTYAGSADATSFECRLDGAAFADCPAEGDTLAGLALGDHAFAVRSRDAAGNIDASPAERTFTVVSAAAPVTPPVIPPVTSDNCTPARDRLEQAKAKLKQAKKRLHRADGTKEIAAAEKKLKKAKAKVAKATDAVDEACSA